MTKSPPSPFDFLLPLHNFVKEARGLVAFPTLFSTVKGVTLGRVRGRSLMIFDKIVVTVLASVYSRTKRRRTRGSRMNQPHSSMLSLHCLSRDHHKNAQSSKPIWPICDTVPFCGKASKFS